VAQRRGKPTERISRAARQIGEPATTAIHALAGNVLPVQDTCGSITMPRTNQDNSDTLRHRIDQQIAVAEWLRHAAEPHGQTLVGAAPQFELLATALAAHVSKLKELRGLV
jgi:hypothetical protein